MVQPERQLLQQTARFPAKKHLLLKLKYADAQLRRTDTSSEHVQISAPPTPRPILSDARLDL